MRLDREESLKLLSVIALELLTTGKHNCYLNHGKVIHQLRSIRSDVPIIDEFVELDSSLNTNQLDISILEITNVEIQRYPNVRITDFTDLRPTRPTYTADVILYTRYPYCDRLYV